MVTFYDDQKGFHLLFPKKKENFTTGVNELGNAIKKEYATSKINNLGEWVQQKLKLNPKPENVQRDTVSNIFKRMKIISSSEIQMMKNADTLEAFDKQIDSVLRSINYNLKKTREQNDLNEPNKPIIYAPTRTLLNDKIHKLQEVHQEIQKQKKFIELEKSFEKSETTLTEELFLLTEKIHRKDPSDRASLLQSVSKKIELMNETIQKIEIELKKIDQSRDLRHLAGLEDRLRRTLLKPLENQSHGLNIDQMDAQLVMELSSKDSSIIHKLTAITTIDKKISTAVNHKKSELQQLKEQEKLAKAAQRKEQHNAAYETLHATFVSPITPSSQELSAFEESKVKIQKNKAASSDPLVEQGKFAEERESLIKEQKEMISQFISRIVSRRIRTHDKLILKAGETGKEEAIAGYGKELEQVVRETLISLAGQFEWEEVTINEVLELANIPSHLSSISLSESQFAETAMEEILTNHLAQGKPIDATREAYVRDIVSVAAKVFTEKPVNETAYRLADKSIVHLKKKEGEKIPKITLWTEKILGAGTFGTVQVVEELLEGKSSAAKRAKAPEIPINATPEEILLMHEEAQKAKQEAKNECFILGKLHEDKDEEIIGIVEKPHLVFDFQAENQDFSGFATHLYLGNMKSAPLTKEKKIDYTRQLITGLAIAHEKGIVHGDIKPQNCFYDDTKCVLGDWGGAKTDKQMPATGTLGYVFTSDQEEYKKTKSLYDQQTQIIEHLSEKQKEELPLLKSKMDEISLKRDIYALGVTIDEILNPLLNPTEEKTKQFQQLITEMNYSNFLKRPSAAEVLLAFNELFPPSS